MSEIQVLLVEDTEDDMILIRALLRSDGRFVLNHVERLGNAIDALKNGTPVDVIILDLNLPDSTGLDTFKNLHIINPDVPIVILSGHDDEEIAVDAVSLGAQDYASKSSVDDNLLVRMLLYAIERNGRHMAEQRNLVIEGDLSAARQIQQHLLPTNHPEYPGFDIAGLCKPADATAGDFFDYIPRRENQLDLIVADVSGHGFAPAMTMVGTRRLLRTFAPSYDDVGEILTIVNKAIFEDTLPWQFVTLFYARLDLQAKQLCYSGAGHAGTILHQDGSEQTLKSTGFPLGLSNDSCYQTETTVQLEPGDIFLLMTDGAQEARSTEREIFGQDRILEVIRSHAELPAVDLIGKVLESVEQYTCPATIDDDMTFTVVKVHAN